MCFVVNVCNCICLCVFVCYVLIVVRVILCVWWLVEKAYNDSISRFFVR